MITRSTPELSFCSRAKSRTNLSASFCSALDYIEREAGQRRLLITGLHVHAGLVHRGDYLVERNFMFIGVAHGDATRVDCLNGSHRVALNTWNLNQATNWITRHSEIMFHPNFGGVLDLSIASSESGNQCSGSH